MRLKAASLATIAAAAVAILASAGCADPTAPAEGNIQVQNDASVALTAVHIAPCEGGAWGLNRLRAPVAPASSIMIPAAAGCADVRVASATQSAVFEAVIVAAGSTTTIVVRD